MNRIGKLFVVAALIPIWVAAATYSCSATAYKPSSSKSILQSNPASFYDGQFYCKQLKKVSAGGGGAKGSGLDSISEPGTASGKYYAVLRNADFVSGSYTCDYYDEANENGEPFISCDYVNVELSKSFRKDLQTVSDAAAKDFATGGNSFSAYVTKLSAGDSYLKKALEDAYSTIKDFSLHGDQKVKNAIQQAYGQVNQYYNLYTSGNADNRIYTFGTFVAGLVTLDPEIVAKYNEATGKIEIAPFWKQKADKVVDDSSSGIKPFLNGVKSAINSFSGGIKSFVDNLTQFFSPSSAPPPAQASPSRKIGSDFGDVDDYKVASWLDIFEMKLWGFYYDLMRKFDVAYSYLINYMLLLMGGFFGLTFAGKAALNKYLERKSIPGANDMWTKFSVILGSVAIFYVSPATPSSGGGNYPDFYYNQTMMKGAIRTIAVEGSRFATAFSDLGLSAYLNFIAHKEYLMTNTQFRDEFLNKPLEKLVKVQYTIPLADFCTKMYGYKKPYQFVLGDGSDTDQIAPVLQSDPFLSSNNIKQVDYATCANYAKESYRIRYDAYKSLLTVKEEASKRDDDMVFATKMVVYNMNALENAFGWVNTFTVPFSYYLFKYNDIFLSPGIDYDKIEEMSGQYVKGLNLKQTSLFGGFDDNGMSVASSFSYATTQGSKAVAGVIGYLMSYSSYMIMPGFNNIFEAINKKFEAFNQSSMMREMIDAIKEKSSSSKVSPTSVLKFVENKVFGIVKKFTPVKFLDLIGGILTSDFVRTFGFGLLAFILAILIWNMLFNIAFISSIALIILLKIVLYFVDLLVYFLVSTFVVLWAFTTNSQQIILNYFKKGLVLLATPSLIVFTSYLFIFIYELMNVIYLYLLNVFVEGQKVNVEAFSAASWKVDALNAFIQLNSVNVFMEVTIKVIGLLLAYIVIYKGIDWILDSLGLSDAKLISTQGTQEIMQKGERYANPVSA